MWETKTIRINLRKTTSRIIQLTLNMWKTKTSRFQLRKNTTSVHVIQISDDKEYNCSRLEDKKRRYQVSPKPSIYFKDSPQDHNIGLNLVLTGHKNFTTRYPDFFKNIYKKHIPRKPEIIWITFFVPIGSSKEPIKFEIYSDSPTLEYQHNDCNSFCYGNLASDFVLSEDLVSAKEIKMQITKSLSYKFHEYIDKIKFSNEIMVDKERNKDEQRLRYKS